MTVGQRWKRNRDLAIAMVAIEGGSSRFLADVFDLAPSQVCRIVQGIRAEFPGRLTGECIRLAIAEVAADRDRERIADARVSGGFRSRRSAGNAARAG